VYQIASDGTLLQTVDLAPQGVAGIGGLAFDAAGRLLAASINGVVSAALIPPPPPPAPPVLTGVTALANDGTPTSPNLASANVAPTIILTGRGFSPGSRIVFAPRDSAGTEGTIAVAPSAVAADGTSLQVVVPDLAETGPVTILGGNGSVP